MPSFEQLPQQVLEVISQKLSNRLPDSLGGPSLAVFESVDVWILDSFDVLTETDDLTTLAKRTGRWHHQIKSSEGSPFGFATTIPQGPNAEDWSVVSVTQSDISVDIDNTIRFISENKDIPDDSKVHLLIAPAYHLRAFWIIASANHQFIVVADNSGTPLLEKNKIYGVSEFLQVLKSTPVINGLI